MKRVMVQYTVKPDRAAKNEELVREVYDERPRGASGQPCSRSSCRPSVGPSRELASANANRNAGMSRCATSF
jgi:hypothetical protein